MARKPNPSIVELGPISDAIRKLGDERRAERDAITVDETQYQAGRERADSVDTAFETYASAYGKTIANREGWFAMPGNKPLNTDTAWFIRGYWNRVAELVSGTPEHIVRG